MNVARRGGAGGSVRFTLNGEEAAAGEGATVGQLVDRVVRDRSRVAVERNREIVPRARYDSTAVEEGDVIEVVTLVGGG
ncbi:MAG: sulfur carrier protein ThiS [Planctomycetes bacterium]|nr:sulfur carrier protein ThiS [Planctomycetota bacterium]